MIVRKNKIDKIFTSLFLICIVLTDTSIAKPLTTKDPAHAKAKENSTQCAKKIKKQKEEHSQCFEQGIAWEKAFAKNSDPAAAAGQKQGFWAKIFNRKSK